MALGCMRRACRWDAGGAATAPLPATRVRLRRRRNCGTSATWVTQKVVRAYLSSELGIQFVLEREPSTMAQESGVEGAFTCVTFASGVIAQPGTVFWNLMRMRMRLAAQSRIPTAGCNAWRNAFSHRISKGKKISRILRRLRQGEAAQVRKNRSQVRKHCSAQSANRKDL
jgi:hypothetical protein